MLYPNACWRTSSVPGSGERSRDRGIELVEVHGSLADPLAVGVCGASCVLTAASSRIRPAAVSTSRSRPGSSRHLRAIRSSGRSSTPASDAITTRPSSVRDTAPVEPVAIEGRADHAAVGERDRGRSVPGLEQRAVKLVERATLVVHQRVLVPRLGDHHHHRVLDRATGHRKQLERVVELRGVRSGLIEHGHELRDVIAEMRAAELRLTRAHPVDVAAQRVDLAVVRRHAGTAAPDPSAAARSSRTARAPVRAPRSRARRARSG